VAVAFLGLRVDLGAVHWPMLVVTLLVGLVPVLALGILLAAACLQTRQDSWNYPEAVAGALFLVSGVVFPLAILPDPVETIGLLNPITWWVGGVRMAIQPDGTSSIGGAGSLWTAVTGSVSPDALTTLLALFATGALATLATVVVFRASERRARQLGLLDRTTGS
jgi:ABC-2 type transport system permease protein